MTLITGPDAMGMDDMGILLITHSSTIIGRIFRSTVKQKRTRRLLELRNLLGFVQPLLMHIVVCCVLAVYRLQR